LHTRRELTLYVLFTKYLLRLLYSLLQLIMVELDINKTTRIISNLIKSICFIFSKDNFLVFFVIIRIHYLIFAHLVFSECT
jgi:hypothetical protein